MAIVTPDQAYLKAYACYGAGQFAKAQNLRRSILSAAPDMLACYLLADSPRCHIVLPVYFMSKHPPTQEALAALRGGLPDAAPMEGWRSGSSFG